MIYNKKKRKLLGVVDKDKSEKPAAHVVNVDGAKKSTTRAPSKASKAAAAAGAEAPKGGRGRKSKVQLKKKEVGEGEAVVKDSARKDKVIAESVAMEEIHNEGELSPKA